MRSFARRPRASLQHPPATLKNHKRRHIKDIYRLNFRILSFTYLDSALGVYESDADDSHPPCLIPPVMPGVHGHGERVLRSLISPPRPSSR